MLLSGNTLDLDLLGKWGSYEFKLTPAVTDADGAAVLARVSSNSLVGESKTVM
jgi:hypothetical protein